MPVAHCVFQKSFLGGAFFMKLFKILAIAALAIVSSVSAQAGVLTNVVLSNMGGDGNTTTLSSSSDVTGLKLGGSGFMVGASDFYLAAINVGVFGGGDITASIVDANGANPGSTVFASRTQAVSASAQIVTFDFDDFQLTANQSYFVTLKGTNGDSWYVKTSAPEVFAPGGLTFVSSRYTEDGSNWDPALGNFQIAYSGSTIPPAAVPEPALTSLLCLSGIALIRRRMKK
jgi:hypothetical protein